MAELLGLGFGWGLNTTLYEQGIVLISYHYSGVFDFFQVLVKWSAIPSIFGVSTTKYTL